MRQGMREDSRLPQMYRVTAEAAMLSKSEAKAIKTNDGQVQRDP